MYKDPLLFTQPYASQPDPMAQLEEEKRKLEEKMSQLRQTGPQQQMRPQAPVWDEIDTIVSGLSDQELQFLNSNQEFQESSASANTSVSCALWWNLPKTESRLLKII